MGKRSSFERIPRDFYPTPPEAVKPLVPHLHERYSVYCEPCAGDGALITALQGLWPIGWCNRAIDIDPKTEAIDQMDAFSLRPHHFDGVGTGYIITNPPWDRKILHPMIDHFSAMRPTWLLFDADWMHTKQSAPFMPWLRKVVSVGRVKWIPDSKYTGKDNCCWYLFDQNAEGPTEFIGRAA